MAEDKKRSNRLWLWLSLGIILVIVFFVTRSLLREHLAVRVAEVGHEELRNTISTNGRVEPISNYAFYSPISTTVKSVNVMPGDKVKTGQVLLVLDDLSARAREASALSGVKSAQAGLDAALHNGTQEQQQMAAADLTRAKLDRDQAQHDLDALTRLNSTGAASASEVGAARSRLQTAEASLHAAQVASTGRYSPADVERARAAITDAEANLAAARDVVDKTVIRAPAPGTVYDVQVAKTEYAEQGKLILQMADLTKERVRAYFDEPDIGHLAAGQKIVIKWDAKPGKEWHGHVDRPPITVITYGTRHVGEVLVSIDDADGTLLPETNVNVTVTTSSEPGVLSIPREALFSQNGQPYVFKVSGDTLERTNVVTGIVNLTRVAILSGLKDGDQVATGTLSTQPLQDGVPIKVVPR
ncbi:MAG TPA: efflux RND transporter periplasmic adaptor subunit [Terracidiphilus sp.]|nr:efflux RND transporter periplasmic adaptor subunit [Terracidiphilus sp.]